MSLIRPRVIWHAGHICSLSNRFTRLKEIVMTYRSQIKKQDRFDRAQEFTTTPGGVFGWTIKDTSAAGTPTYLCTADGAVLTTTATSEAQILTLYQNNVLPFLLNKIRRVEFTAKLSGVDAVTLLTMGLASAQNDTPDSVMINAWFRLQGSVSQTLLLLETDDNVTDNDDKATGVVIGVDTFKRYMIDFSQGLSKVMFLIDGQPVGAIDFSMTGAGATQGMQVFFQLQKASGTGVPILTIRDVEIEYITAD